MKNKLDPFTQSYIVAALWSSNDDCGNPLDEHFGILHINNETINQVINDCDKFQKNNKDLLEQAYQKTGYGKEESGHDFWLTRNGHGVGFWDRDLGDIGQQLTEKCKEVGSVDCYVGDDNKIYFTDPQIPYNLRKKP